MEIEISQPEALEVYYPWTNDITLSVAYLLLYKNFTFIFYAYIISSGVCNSYGQVGAPGTRAKGASAQKVKKKGGRIRKRTNDKKRGEKEENQRITKI